MEYDRDHINLQGEIINYSIKIEHMINSILLLYFKPKHNVLFASHMLNSSVISFGGKLKVLKAIGLQNKDYSSLQKLGSIRNSFAHTNSCFNYASLFLNTQSKAEMSIMNSNGTITSKDPKALHDDYIVLYLEISAALDVLKEEITKQESKSE